ncbi:MULTISPECIES: type IV pilus assembly protein PilM [unclassified Frondihabitans]|jgi:type IV pilus assembly protein PilM|uniref:type IV pilus assembly protein PilM n=1 Tax=unclassified Frondihabitans TaxID=2626248 RepID=UPI0006FD9108|nr:MULTISPECIES: type IV pilus assembly protein PilM [unclassified Frondihabitans]KQQ25713.1 pilus assembly protein PilM [Frondihabitans sp. Leaf304]MBF4574921.1 type IV pilus assembly protein PilM [Frondihabitans sp. VKM Ac-2883]
MSKSIVGVDIGAASLRAVEIANPTSARPTLVRFGEVPLPAGSVSRGEVIEPQTVAQSMRALWSQAGFKSKQVVLGMGNQRVLARDLTVAKASKARIQEALPFQVQDMLPIPVADALLDFYPVSEGIGEHGPVINGLLIAAVKDAVLGNVRASKLAGLHAVGVDLIPFAVSRLLVNRARLTGTVALIDIGASTTSVVLVSDGVPQFVRLIPSGGDDITNDLASRLEIPRELAEGAKRTLGLVSSSATKEDKTASAVIFETVNELLGSLRNTVSYYANTRPTEHVTHIVLSGGGAQLRGLPEALAEVTRIPVVAADPLQGVSFARSASEADVRSNVTSLTVALGLALGSAA